MAAMRDYTFDDGAGGGVQGLAVAITGLVGALGEQADFIINGVDVKCGILFLCC